MPDSSLAAQRAAIARAERRARTTGDHSEALEARRDYAASKIEDYLTRALSDSPPLSGEQLTRLATLVHGGAA